MQPESRARLEQALLKALSGSFTAAKGTVDLISRDKSLGLDLNLGLQSIRDFQAAVIQLASHLEDPAGPGTLCLITHLPRISRTRILDEWQAIGRLMRREIFKRLALITLGEGPSLTLPNVPKLTALAQQCGKAWTGGDQGEPPYSSSMPSERFFEIFKVALLHWCRSRQPLSIHRILEQSGASYTSVAQALKRLEKAHELRRHSNRSVELVGFPKTTWSEVRALLNPLRRSRYYADGSGRNISPQSLVDKLKNLGRNDVAVGGTLAARKGDRGFDLHGTPRLDLSVHEPKGVRAADIVAQLSSSLRPCPSDDPGIVLAIHPLGRALPLFNVRSKGGIWMSDEVETLLDLHELHLTAQADELLQRAMERRDSKADGIP
jgi:hypothetical protein